MFYLSGKDISTVRFSCKNQQINFMDWTEKRDEFGLAQNFTVSYGEDESEYWLDSLSYLQEQNAYKNSPRYSARKFSALLSKV